jgi:hypothetical protein
MSCATDFRLSPFLFRRCRLFKDVQRAQITLSASGLNGYSDRAS